MEKIIEKIINAIENTYHKKYVGILEITKNNIGYSVGLGFNNSDKPTVISLEIEDEDLFIKEFIKELRLSNFSLNNYYETRLTYDPDITYDQLIKIIYRNNISKEITNGK